MQLPKKTEPRLSLFVEMHANCHVLILKQTPVTKNAMCHFFHHQGSLQILKQLFFSASAKHFSSFSSSSGPPRQIGTLHFCWTAYCRGDTVPSRKTSSISTKRGLTSSNSLSRFVKRHGWGRFGSGIKGASTCRVRPLMDFAHLGNY